MKAAEMSHIIASVLGIPLALVTVIAALCLPLKLYLHWCPRVLFIPGMVGMLGFPTTIGLGISVAALLSATISMSLATRAGSLTPRKKTILMVYALTASAALTYGIWFNVTRQGDRMF